VTLALDTPNESTGNSGKRWKYGPLHEIKNATDIWNCEKLL
jgi:hypothetical protein